MTHRRLAAVERSEEIARADFTGGRDEAQQPESHRIGERGKDVRQLGGIGLTQWRLEHPGAAGLRVGWGTGHERPPGFALTLLDISAMIDASTNANLYQEQR